MEDAEIDERVRRHEEVGEQRADGIEIPYEDAGERDDEDEDVAANGVVVAPAALAQGGQAGEQLVAGDGL